MLSEDAGVENERLRAYISELESRLQGDVSRRGLTAILPGATDSTDANSLERLLMDVIPPPQPSEVSNHSTPVADQPEEDIGSACAPLVRLLNNPALGTALYSTQDEKDGRGLASDKSTWGSPERESVVRDMCASLPTKHEFDDILDNKSSWWPLYRDTLGLVWGEEECESLRAFAVQALKAKHPSLIGILLTSLAISTGDLQKYLPAVERRIVNVDEYAGCEYGLGCLMALGLCYISSLQPRRAWTIYRRANALLQLNGLHVRRKTEKHELLFWQLFHADRWVSLMIGLPYCISEDFCDVAVQSMGEISPGTWLYRQLGLLTGLVIDCLQNVKGPTWTSILRVEERMDEIKAQLPVQYMDLNDIRTCTDLSDKYTRLYRLIHWHQLRAHIHLPFLLRSGTQERYRFNRECCVEDCRRLLEGYLEIFDTDPAVAAFGTVLNFTAFVAAVIVLMNVACYQQTPQAQADQDWRMLYRVMDAIKHGGTTDVAGLICRKCHTALEQLVSSARLPDEGEIPKRVVLPYFGTLIITKPVSQSVSGRAADQPDQSVQAATMTGDRRDWTTSTTVTSALSTTFNVGMNGPAMNTNISMHDGQNPGAGLSFAYNGPFLPPDDPFGYGSLPVTGSGFGWFDDFDMGADWSWLTADLPPTVGT